MDRSCPLTEVYIFSHFGRRIVSGVVHLSPLCLGASVDRVGRCILSGDGPFLSPVRDAILVCMHTVFGVGSVLYRLFLTTSERQDKVQTIPIAICATCASFRSRNLFHKLVTKMFRHRGGGRRGVDKRGVDPIQHRYPHTQECTHKVPESASHGMLRRVQPPIQM